MSGNLTLEQNGATWVWGQSNVNNVEFAPVTGGASTHQQYSMYHVDNNQWMWQTQGYTAGQATTFPYDIQREISTNSWSDVGGDAPGYFKMDSSTTAPSSSSATVATIPQQATSVNKYLHLFTGGSVYMGYVDVWTPFNTSVNSWIEAESDGFNSWTGSTAPQNFVSEYCSKLRSYKGPQHNSKPTLTFEWDHENVTGTFVSHLGANNVQYTFTRNGDTTTAWSSYYAITGGEYYQTLQGVALQHGDTITMHSDQDMQISTDGGNTTFWVTAGNPLHTYTHVATEVSGSADEGVPGDTISVSFTDNNAYPDFMHYVYITGEDWDGNDLYAGTVGVTIETFGTTSQVQLPATTPHQVTGSFVALEGIYRFYKKSPHPMNHSYFMFQRTYGTNPNASSSSNRRRAHSFW